MKLLIKMPTRNRPDKFIQVFMKYKHMVSGKHHVSFLISMDEDDPKMNCDRIREFLSKQTDTAFYYGHSKTKIQACNADLDKAGDFDVILLASDDMIPMLPGYDDIIVRDMQANFPDLDGVLHYNDGRVGDRLNTFCIMGKKYFDRFGYFYHPEYVSVFCDNEFTDVSRSLGKAKYSDLVLFYHGWVQFVGYDELAQRNETPAMYAVDGPTYQRRKAAGFPI